MRRVWTAVATLVAGLSGCGRSGDIPGNSVAVAVPTEDTAIEAASHQARSSIEEFKKAITNPGPEQTDFSVKVELLDDGAVHLVWLQEVVCSGSDFTGTLGSDVSGMSDHKPGQTITVGADNVADWMYVERKRLISGFTIRAIRDRLSGPQRDAFERSMWFDFD